MTHTTKAQETLVLFFTDNNGEHCYKCKPTQLVRNLIILNSDEDVIEVCVSNLYTNVCYMDTKENYISKNILTMIAEYTNKNI